MATALASLVSFRDFIDRRTLTLRQREILDLTVGGKSQEEIATYLRLSSRQIRRDSEPILDALGAAAAEHQRLLREGKLRIGVTIQMSRRRAQWRRDKIVKKVVGKLKRDKLMSDLG